MPNERDSEPSWSEVHSFEEWVIEMLKARKGKTPEFQAVVQFYGRQKVEAIWQKHKTAGMQNRPMEKKMDIEKLKNRDYVLVIDKSGSMQTMDCAGGKSRWQTCQESTLAIATKLNEYDPDGITVIPFAGSYKVYENTTPAKVAQVFQENEPIGGTTLAPVLAKVFGDYNARKAAGKTKANGEILLVVTDGAPQDESAVASEIIKFTKTLENGDAEYGVSFLQVGKDAQAAAFLKKLDDDLEKQGAKFDIVDTKTMDEIENIGLTEALVAALTD